MGGYSDEEIEALSARLEQIHRVVDAVPAMLAYWDAEQRCVFANRTYESWFGISPAAMVGKTLRELLGPLYPVHQPHIEGALRGELQEFEHEIPDPWGGVTRCGHAHYIPDLGSGEVRGFAVLVSDVTQRKRLEEMLREEKRKTDAIATHDFLTGLPNRVLLEDRLSRAIENARRYERRGAVLFLDLDGFKRVNDDFGHAAGDQVLVEVAQRLTASLRKADSVTRLGGDEFVVLVTEIYTRERVALVAQKLLDAIMNKAFSVGTQTLMLSVSIGVSLVPEDGTEARELLGNADAALYRAKSAGKNRFAFFSDE